MQYFTYQNQELSCEQVPLKEIAQKLGTPAYVYSYAALKHQFTSFTQAFSGIDHLICFSMKANSNAAILKTFINLGSGIDVVTGGELYRALKAGCPANKIVFSGVGKSDSEIEMALNAGILQFNVESIDELSAIQNVAARLNKKAPIALRVNPDVDPKTHAYISTGLKKSKFGISHEKTVDTYKKARDMANIEIVGIDCHIGSQLTTTAPFVEALGKVKNLINALKAEGITVRHLDFGGGLGITYNNETPPSPADYAAALKGIMTELGLKLIFEPGRFLVGNTGVLLTKVLYNKGRDNKKFVIVDAASNDLMRPAMYDAYHDIKPLSQKTGETQVVDVVGPICETGDFFAHDRALPALSNGEYAAIMSAGAYGFSMSSTYNSRPRAVEVMVNGKDYEIVRERETLEDLVKGEKIPSFLK
ncbi:diaminopimelate decarboxylase [bacterium]|nr:diaminopimelate decarboxylase [bacterium]